jgi:hypothetical protein
MQYEKKSKVKNAESPWSQSKFVLRLRIQVKINKNLVK